jgi:hypothetical protein
VEREPTTRLEIAPPYFIALDDLLYKVRVFAQAGLANMTAFLNPLLLPFLARSKGKRK